MQTPQLCRPSIPRKRPTHRTRAGGTPAGCQQRCSLRPQRPRTAPAEWFAEASAHPARRSCCANRLVRGT